MQECKTVLFHRKKTKNNHKNVRKTCYWELIFVICSYSTWVRGHAKHAKDVGTWARRPAGHVGKWAHEHAMHVGTWAHKQQSSELFSLSFFSARFFKYHNCASSILESGGTFCSRGNFNWMENDLNSWCSTFLYLLTYLLL